jgi:ABC-2 type transport system ATP-binding protein
MNAIELSHVSYRYGRVSALRDATLTVPEGALYALLGPNGSGKTTLLQILMGLRRAATGRATVLGIDAAHLAAHERSRVGYVAEGQVLPGWMKLAQLEAYLAPLYETWDAQLARELRDRFELDPTRKIRTLSRGERMKAALLCALAPRPKLLVMDEPFTGMDALVKDDLVRGLLASSGAEGWTVLVCSHDIGELELLADWLGFLDHGTVSLSEPMDRAREQFTRIDVTLPSDRALADIGALPAEWMSVETAAGGRRIGFALRAESRAAAEHMVRARLGEAARIESREASLREIFVALASTGPAHHPAEAAA